MDIKRRANQIVRFFHSRDPFEIIQGLNVILVYYPLNGVRGFYQYFQRNNIVYLDERLSDRDKKFVLAHEMGHMYLHKKTNTIFMDTRTHFNTTKYELEADRFAMNLLISDSAIEDHVDFTLAQFSRLFGYSKQLIELRLKDFE